MAQHCMHKHHGSNFEANVNISKRTIRRNYSALWNIVVLKQQQHFSECLPETFETCCPWGVIFQWICILFDRLSSTLVIKFWLYTFYAQYHDSKGYHTNLMIYNAITIPCRHNVSTTSSLRWTTHLLLIIYIQQNVLFEHLDTHYFKHQGHICGSSIFSIWSFKCSMTF